VATIAIASLSGGLQPLPSAGEDPHDQPGWGGFTRFGDHDPYSAHHSRRVERLV